MRLTRAGEYAVRCVIYLSRRGQGVLVSRQEVATRADIPTHFLAKIAQQLARAKIIDILQGARGGYMLLINPGELTLLQVVETIIGEIFLNDCVLRPQSCRASATCTVNKIWHLASNQLRDTLRTVTFEDLIKDKSCCSVPLLPGEIAAYDDDHQDSEEE